MPRSPFPLLAGLITAGMVLAGTLLLDHLESAHHVRQQREEVTRHLLRWQARLNALMERQLALLHQAVAYARHAPPNQKNFQNFAQELTASFPSVHTLLVAPAGEVALLHPQPNPAFTLKQDLLNEAENSALMVNAIQERVVTLSGPVVLRNGARVLVERLAIFDPKNAKPDAENNFWGLGMMYIAWPDALREGGLTPWTSNGDRVAIRLMLQGGEPGEVILGQKELFDGHPVTLTQSWFGSSWELAAMPEKGWITSWPHHGDMMRMGGSLALVLGGFMMLLAQPDRRRRREPDLPVHAAAGEETSPAAPTPDPTAMLLAHLLNRAEETGKVGHWRWEGPDHPLEFSPYLAHLFGFSPGGKHATLLPWLRPIPRSERPRVIHGLRQILSGVLAHHRIRFPVRLPNGELCALEASTEILPGPEGKGVRLTGMVRDITAERLAAQELELARRELKSRQRHHSQILAQTARALDTARAARLQVEVTLGLREARLQTLESAHQQLLALLEQGRFPLHVADLATGETLRLNPPGQALLEAAPQTPWYLPSLSETGVPGSTLHQEELTWSDGRRVRLTLALESALAREQELRLVREAEERHRQELEELRSTLSQEWRERLQSLEGVNGDLIREREEHLHALERMQGENERLQADGEQERQGHQQALEQLHLELETGKAHLEQLHAALAREQEYLHPLEEEHAARGEALEQLAAALERAQREHQEQQQEGQRQREDLAAALERAQREHREQQEEGQRQREDLSAALERAQREHQEQQEEGQRQREELAAALERAQREHQEQQEEGQRQLDTLSAALERAQREHQEQQEEGQRQRDTLSAALERAQREHQEQQEEGQRQRDTLSAALERAQREHQEAMAAQQEALEYARVRHLEEQAGQEAQGRAARLEGAWFLARSIGQEMHLPGTALHYQLLQAREAWNEVLPLLESAFPPDTGPMARRPPHAAMQRKMERALNALTGNMERMRRIETGLKQISPAQDGSAPQALVLERLLENSAVRLPGIRLEKAGFADLPLLYGEPLGLELLLHALLHAMGSSLPEGVRALTVQAEPGDGQVRVRAGFGSPPDPEREAEAVPSFLALVERMARSQQGQLLYYGGEQEARWALLELPAAPGGTA